MTWGMNDTSDSCDQTFNSSWSKFGVMLFRIHEHQMNIYEHLFCNIFSYTYVYPYFCWAAQNAFMYFIIIKLDRLENLYRRWVGLSFN